MDVTKNRIKFILLSLSSFISLIQNTFAEMMEKGRTKVTSVFNFYHQNSNNGGQVVDNSGREEDHVIEPMVFIEHQIKEDTAISGQLTFDAWTAASDTKIDSYTGASGGDGIKNQARISANLGARQEKGKWSYGANFGFSTEYDYQSINGSVNISRSFAEDNFTLGFGLQYYMDQLSAFTDISNPSQAQITTGLDRKILASSITASQILSPIDIIQFDATFARSTGFLESTANTVRVNGVRAVEQLPDSRSRYALSTKYVRALGESSALNLSYRYYFDQWDVSSHTTRAAYLFDLNEDEDFIELFVRHHYQDKVEYFSDNFSSAQTFMTSDSDMNEFTSYEGGIYLNQNYDDKKVFGVDLENFSWNHGFVYYTRTNGLRYGYYQTSVSFEF